MFWRKSFLLITLIFMCFSCGVLPSIGEDEFSSSFGAKFVLLQPGSFRMGSANGDGDEKPVHTVNITKPFYLGVTEVTQAQWEKVMGFNPSKFKGPNRPVEQVSWNDCWEFVKRLNGLGEGRYRLPTEAEWEYACRAGSNTRYCFGDSESELCDYAWYDIRLWYDSYSSTKAHDVGRKKPNAWGLFDMHGNVWEWCEDWYVGSYPGDTQADPQGPSSGSGSVVRGGGWDFGAGSCRSAFRFCSSPDDLDCSLGLRLVRECVDTENSKVGNKLGVVQPVSGDSDGALFGTAACRDVLSILLPGNMKMKFCKIPKGSFMMGSPASEEDRHKDEGPQHKVTISAPFYLGIYEVTQEQWKAVMGKNPSRFRESPKNPVEQVSWIDCREFITKINKLGKGKFRLPTEAEWEYACRAGTKTRFYWGEDPDLREIGLYAWYGGNTWYDKNTGCWPALAVGKRKPNPWGLYDMAGNVWEWCRDWYGIPYPEDEEIDPCGPSEGTEPLYRGGCCNYEAEYCRSAHRHWYKPSYRRYNIGLRLVRECD